MRASLPVAAFTVLLVAVPATSVPALKALNDLNDLLKAAGNYSGSYHEQFTTIVAEERYVQRVVPQPRVGSGRWPLEGVIGDEARRTLRSDVMLVRGVRGENAWFFFRDVFESDGVSVSTDRGRLESWLRESRESFMHKARALALEQARFNLGDILRTINVPLLSLQFLLPEHQGRFRFRTGKSSIVNGVAVTSMSYDERRHPTMIRTPEGDDIEARGTFWIEPRTGRVFKSELRTDAARRPPQVRATITVTYEPNERLGMLVPVTMEESYSAGAVQIEGTAHYSNFRRFETGARIVR